MTTFKFFVTVWYRIIHSQCPPNSEMKYQRFLICNLNFRDHKHRYTCMYISHQTFRTLKVPSRSPSSLANYNSLIRKKNSQNAINIKLGDSRYLTDFSSRRALSSQIIWAHVFLSVMKWALSGWYLFSGYQLLIIRKVEVSLHKNPFLLFWLKEGDGSIKRKNQYW